MEAQPTYQGGKEYQPVLAFWAEMDLVVADKLREGMCRSIHRC